VPFEGEEVEHYGSDLPDQVVVALGLLHARKPPSDPDARHPAALLDLTRPAHDQAAVPQVQHGTFVFPDNGDDAARVETRCEINMVEQVREVLAVILVVGILPRVSITAMLAPALLTPGPPEAHRRLFPFFRHVVGLGRTSGCR